VFVELLNSVDENKICDPVGLVGFQIWEEVSGREISRILWREWGGGFRAVGCRDIRRFATF
jgi:hypothetical protein